LSEEKYYNFGLNEDSQGTDSKNYANVELRPTIHLQVPDHENRQDTIRPIRPAAHGRVGVGRGRNDIRIDTASFHARKLSPEIGHWPALENNNEETVGTHDC
jgi:hypothetical protein